MSQKNNQNGKEKSVVDFVNDSGFGFQAAVLKETERLFREKHSHWSFEVEEYPVSVQGKTARIDFILKQNEMDRFIVAECKRVGPGQAWCFMKSPFVRRDYNPSDLGVDKLYKDGRNTYRGRHSLSHLEAGVFHQAVPLKSSEYGELKGSLNRSAIEDACKQVFTGTNGFIDGIVKDSSLWPSESAMFIPVVFTTAPLLVLDKDLDTSSLETGDLPNDTRVEKVDWLWLRQHVWPSVISDVQIADSEFQKDLGNSLSRKLDNEFARTVAIVNCSGIEDFLSNVQNCE